LKLAFCCDGKKEGALWETEPSPREYSLARAYPWALGEELFVESKKIILNEEKNSR
jgi:hypothetical protein